MNIKMMDETERTEFTLFLKDIRKRIDDTLNELELENDMYAMVHFATLVIFTRELPKRGYALMHSKTAEEFRQKIEKGLDKENN